MQYATRNKLSQQQQQAALTIFGPELGASIVSAAQKQIDDLDQHLTALKSAVADMDSRLTALERAKGIDLADRFYQANGRPDTGLTSSYFGGAA